MLKIITLMTDQIFPPRQHERIVREVEMETLSLLRSDSKHRNLRYLLPYENRVTEALILENKFHRNPKAATLLARTLEQWLLEQAVELVIIPIPLGPERKKSRGYNQVTEILHKVRLTTKQSLALDILRRDVDTVPQTSLNRTDRLKNIVGAFSCSNLEKLRLLHGKTVVLVDDVTTTGSTLEVARATLAPLLPPGTNIICLALAH